MRVFSTAWRQIPRRTRISRGCYTQRAGFRVCFGLKMADEWGTTRGRAKVDDGRWRHAVGVYDGTQVALYIDGKLDAAASASRQIATSNEPVLIGENSEKPSRFWHGILDEVRIYSYTLSEDEITALYKEATVDAGTDHP